jgi:hypothetical protein
MKSVIHRIHGRLRSLSPSTDIFLGCGQFQIFLVLPSVLLGIPCSVPL